MKTYQCLRTCYASLLDGEKHRLFEAGELAELPDDFELDESLESKFVCISEPDEEKQLDYALATKEMLMAHPLELKPLADFCKTTMEYDLVKGSKKKEEIVDEFLAAREEFNLSASNPHTS